MRYSSCPLSSRSAHPGLRAVIAGGLSGNLLCHKLLSRFDVDQLQRGIGEPLRGCPRPIRFGRHLAVAGARRKPTISKDLDRRITPLNKCERQVTRLATQGLIAGQITLTIDVRSMAAVYGMTLDTLMKVIRSAAGTSFVAETYFKTGGSGHSGSRGEAIVRGVRRLT